MLDFGIQFFRVRGPKTHIRTSAKTLHLLESGVELGAISSRFETLRSVLTPFSLTQLIECLSFYLLTQRDCSVCLLLRVLIVSCPHRYVVLIRFFDRFFVDRHFLILELFFLLHIGMSRILCLLSVHVGGIRNSL